MITSAAASAALGKHLPDEGKKPKKAKKDKRSLTALCKFRRCPWVSLFLRSAVIRSRLHLTFFQLMQAEEEVKIRPRMTTWDVFYKCNHAPDFMGHLTMFGCEYKADNFEFEVVATKEDDDDLDFDIQLANLDIDWDEEGPVHIIFDAGEFLLCLFFNHFITISYHVLS
jgi:hypothetical protein